MRAFGRAGNNDLRAHARAVVAGNFESDVDLRVHLRSLVEARARSRPISTCEGQASIAAEQRERRRPRDILPQTRNQEKPSREKDCSSARLLNTKASQS